MEIYGILLIVSVLLLAILLASVLILWFRSQRNQSEMSQKSLTIMSQSLVHNAKQQTEQMQILATLSDKAMALVASKDPMTFQQLQLMNQSSVYDDAVPFDPSDEGEMKRIAEREPGADEREDLNGLEEAILDDLGLDAEFFRPYSSDIEQ